MTKRKLNSRHKKNADKFLMETVNAFVDLSDKMVLDPKIETYLGHNQFEALKLLIYSEIAMANISKEYFYIFRSVGCCCRENHGKVFGI